MYITGCLYEILDHVAPGAQFIRTSAHAGDEGLIPAKEIYVVRSFRCYVKIYKIIMLLVVLYECETRLLIG